jgi:hypothetical protein
MKNQIDEKIISAAVNGKTIAKIIGLTDKRIAQLANENRIPGADENGFYPLGATVQKYCENLRSRAEAGTITSAKRRKMEASAAISEMDLAMKRGEMVKLSDVERVWTEAIISAREIICQSALTRKEQDEVLELLASADHTQNLQKTNA